MLWSLCVLLKTHFTEILPHPEIVEFCLERVLLTSQTDEQIWTAGDGQDQDRKTFRWFQIYISIYTFLKTFKSGTYAADSERPTFNLLPLKKKKSIKH